MIFSVKLEKRCDIVGHTSEETFGLTLGSCAVICRACWVARLLLAQAALIDLLGNRGASDLEIFLKCITLNRASRSHAKTGLFSALFWCVF